MELTRKFYEINYNKANGTKGTLNVKARNKKEAIVNAKDNCFTGSNFNVIKEIETTKDTVFGGGSHRMNK